MVVPSANKVGVKTRQGGRLIMAETATGTWAFELHLRRIIDVTGFGSGPGGSTDADENQKRGGKRTFD